MERFEEMTLERLNEILERKENSAFLISQEIANTSDKEVDYEFGMSIPSYSDSDIQRIFDSIAMNPDMKNKWYYFIFKLDLINGQVFYKNTDEKDCEIRVVFFNDIEG